MRGFFALPSRSGGDLLSHDFCRSTIGATALNFRVRDGIGCLARAVTTRPGRERTSVYLPSCHLNFRFVPGVLGSFDLNPAFSGSDQACRAISTGQLSALLRLHLRPIDVVVYHGPDGETLF